MSSFKSSPAIATRGGPKPKYTAGSCSPAGPAVVFPPDSPDTSNATNRPCNSAAPAAIASLKVRVMRVSVLTPVWPFLGSKCNTCGETESPTTNVYSSTLRPMKGTPVMSESRPMLINREHSWSLPADVVWVALFTRLCTLTSSTLSSTAKLLLGKSISRGSPWQRNDTDPVYPIWMGLSKATRICKSAGNLSFEPDAGVTSTIVGGEQWP
mmetsp:Transcript_36519/g.100557  ORF Transcript_36519/g.100557 Transcript_36519/m.100557 type:complete len:211 (+) Transcript_36519:1295-1927(+)